MSFLVEAILWWVLVPSLAVIGVGGVLAVIDRAREEAAAAVLWDDFDWDMENVRQLRPYDWDAA